MATANDFRSDSESSVAANGNPSPHTLQPSCKIALITGITREDGSYLTKFLLNKGYKVQGLICQSSNFNSQRINHIYIDPHNAQKARMKLHYAELTDASSLRRWLDTIVPDEVYNLASQSHVDVSFEIPDYTIDVVATGALRLLGAEKPDDYVVATEESHSVKEFLTVAFGHVGLDWKDHEVIDKRYFRPAEVDNLKGDASKAKKVLGWKRRDGFEQLVKMMVDEDVELAKRERCLLCRLYGCSTAALMKFISLH